MPRFSGTPTSARPSTSLHLSSLHTEAGSFCKHQVRRVKPRVNKASHAFFSTRKKTHHHDKQREVPQSTINRPDQQCMHANVNHVLVTSPETVTNKLQPFANFQFQDAQVSTKTAISSGKPPENVRRRIGMSKHLFRCITEGFLHLPLTHGYFCTEDTQTVQRERESFVTIVLMCCDLQERFRVRLRIAKSEM